MKHFTKFALTILITLLAYPSYAIFDKQAGFADIVEPLMPAVVNINTVKYAKKKLKRGIHQDSRQFEQFNSLFEQFGMPFFMDEMPSNPKAISLGSGFLIDHQGHIVTNHHVIKDADEISVKLNDNREFKAKLIGSDQRTDIAVLKIDSPNALPYVKFGDSSAVRVGDWVIAVGNPFGLGGTVTTGIISSKSREIDIISGGLIDDYIQTDAAINEGNSGGPMFNMAGEVIGVNSAILSSSGANIGIGFAIPANAVINVVKQLKEHGKIERGRLGVRIQEITPEIADGLGIKELDGVLLAGVEPGSPAQKAGLKAGDIIVEFNNIKIKNVRKLEILVAETPLNKEVSIKALRSGKEILFKVSVKEIQDLTTNQKSSSASKATDEYIINDVKFMNITPELVDSLALDQDKGVVVVSNQSSNYWRNLVRGDILTSVNQAPITSIEDLKTQYQTAKKLGKKNIVLLVQRSSMTLFLALPLGE